MIYRIIDIETKLFLRDDTKWNEETEQAITKKCPQGFSKPKWVFDNEMIDNEDGSVDFVGKWVEGE